MELNPSRFRKLGRIWVIFALGTFFVAGTARAESPFHTGVWQVNFASGPEGLVLSDWLVFKDGLPVRWIYRKAGSNDVNQFDYLTRTIGSDRYDQQEALVYRTGENTMRFSLFRAGTVPIESSAVRLSQPDYAHSCLSVDAALDGRLYERRWVGTRLSVVNSVGLAPSQLLIDDEIIPVNIVTVRTGRIGLIRDGVPIAFLTHAGGDYAVLQWFKHIITIDHMLDPNREIIEFSREDVIRDPKGTCDSEIASRLKLVGTR